MVAQGGALQISLTLPKSLVLIFKIAGRGLRGVSADGWSKAASQLTAGAKVPARRSISRTDIDQHQPKGAQDQFSGALELVRSFERMKFGKDGIYL